ncbi:hypothetical protein BH09BAC1_BH09BAC1_07650 [soil metagenome]
MRKMFQLTAVVLSMMVLAVSCNKDDKGDMGGQANMQVRMTDAPGPYVAVNVDVQAVEMSTDQGWVSMNVHGGIYNLLDYRGGVDTLIAYGPINAGRVEQIRLILGPNNTIVVGPATYDLETPSAEQSGLKLNVHTNVVAGESYTILLDFDAARSIVETGSGKYILKPVIRTILEANTGVIIGDLGISAAGSLVYAINGTDTTGTVANATGNFYFGGLASGSYQVHIDAVPVFNDTTITNVNVSSAQTTNLGSIQLRLL